MWRKNIRQTPQVCADNRERIKQEAEQFGNELLNESPEALKAEQIQVKRTAGRIREKPRPVNTTKEPENTLLKKVQPQKAGPQKKLGRRTRQEVPEEAMKKARELIAKERERKSCREKFGYGEILKKADELKEKGADSLAFMLYGQCYEMAGTYIEKAVCRKRMDIILKEKKGRRWTAGR